MTSEIVYLNGKFIELKDARISVLDRGFIFGDGVYEVIPVYSRRPFRMQEHLRRLQHSLDAIRLPNPHSPAQWTGLIRKIIDRNDAEDQSVYLQVTRGVAKRDHVFPQGVKPTEFIMSNPLSMPPRSYVERGVACVSAVDFRWLRCDVKSVSLLGNVLMRQRAVDAGAVETIMFRDGYLTEASASNVFVVAKGILAAPPKNHLVLPGITYDVVLELANKARIPLSLREIEEDEVKSADEIWITSSTKEVLPVTQLDGKAVGQGRPGAVFKRMHKLYQEYKRGVMRRK
jgi:D-alanine transaminase